MGRSSGGVRALRSEALAPSPGETVVPLDGAGTNTPLAAVPTAAVVRALDAGGRGLPGKEFIPYVYVRSRVAADCLLGGVTLGAANLESPFDQPCAVQSLQAFARDHVRLEVREGEGVTHSSGKDGFLRCRSCTPRSTRSGSAARAVPPSRQATCASSSPTARTPPGRRHLRRSPLPSCRSTRPCVELQLANDLSRYALGSALTSPRRPSVLAGIDVQGFEASTNLDYAFLYNSDQSWLMPPAMDLASTGLAGDDPFAVSCAADTRCNATSCDGMTGADLFLCVAEAYVSATGHYPAIRLRAIDERGNGVQGLRVRLRSLQQAVQPELPRTTEIVSCGLVTRAEYDAEGADAATAYLATLRWMAVRCPRAHAPAYLLCSSLHAFLSSP